MDEPTYAKGGCRHCGGHIAFPAESAGRTVACPHCRQPTELVPLTPPPSPRPTADEIAAAFPEPMARPRQSAGYHASLLLVAVTMILLPLVYVAFVLALLGGAGWYAVHFHHWVTVFGDGPRWYLVKLLVYGGPLFIAAVLAVFLVKPLFARRPKPPEPVALDPAAEPVLFAFVAGICRTVGAPMPAHIYLDCQLNASASLEGRETVLTIGLPLVAGLDLREFAGIMAHEFGHLTQGFGMRLSSVIRTINEWFARVAYERDAWDLWLETWAEEVDDWRTLLVTHGTRLAIWLSRSLLQLLMRLGQGVSCYLMRQMEYDADVYMFQVAGSAVFERTARRLATLGEASRQSYQLMRTTWDSRRQLPENFPALLTRMEARLTPAQRGKIEERAGLSVTGLFDTHPAVGDRIRRAQQAACPGKFLLEGPATQLFTDFDALAKEVSRRHYTDELGLPHEAAALLPADALPADALESTSPNG